MIPCRQVGRYSQRLLSMSDSITYLPTYFYIFILRILYMIHYTIQVGRQIEGIKYVEPYYHPTYIFCIFILQILYMIHDTMQVGRQVQLEVIKYVQLYYLPTYLLLHIHFANLIHDTLYHVGSQVSRQRVLSMPNLTTYLLKSFTYSFCESYT